MINDKGGADGTVAAPCMPRDVQTREQLINRDLEIAAAGLRREQSIGFAAVFRDARR
jgi:hypothetical protein